MIAINPTGRAASLSPNGVRGNSGTYTCDLYLMQGTMPAANVLENIATSSELTSSYSNYIYKFSGLSISTIYSDITAERSFKKTPVDALEFNALSTGTVSWAVIVFSGEKMMFTDSIGNWDNDEAVITINNLNCVQNEQNILKDINLIIREKSTYELNPTGIFQG